MGEITDAANANDHLGLLKATRKVIARAIDNEDTPPRDLAALTRRLTDVNKEIVTLELQLGREGKTVDGKSGGDSGGGAAGQAADNAWTPEDV